MEPNPDDIKMDLSDEEENLNQHLHQAMLDEERERLQSSRSEGNLNLGPLPVYNSSSGHTSSTGSLNVHLNNLNVNAGGSNTSQAGPSSTSATSVVNTSTTTTVSAVQTPAVATTSTVTAGTSTSMPVTPLDQVSKSSFFSCSSGSKSTFVPTGLSISKLKEIKDLLLSTLDDYNSVDRIASDSSFVCTPYNSPGNRRVTRSYFKRKDSLTSTDIPTPKGKRGLRSSKSGSVVKINNPGSSKSLENIFSLGGPSLTQIMGSDLVQVNSTPREPGPASHSGKRASPQEAQAFSQPDFELNHFASPPLPQRSSPRGRGLRRAQTKTLRSAALGVNGEAGPRAFTTGSAISDVNINKNKGEELSRVHVENNHVELNMATTSHAVYYTPTQYTQEDLHNLNIQTQDPNLPSSVPSSQCTTLHLDSISSPNARQKVKDSLPVVPSDSSGTSNVTNDSLSSGHTASMSTISNHSEPLIPGQRTPPPTNLPPGEAASIIQVSPIPMDPLITGIDDAENFENNLNTTTNSGENQEISEPQVPENDPIKALLDLAKNTTFSSKDTNTETNINPPKPSRVKFSNQPRGILKPIDTWEKYLLSLDDNPFLSQSNFSNLLDDLGHPNGHSSPGNNRNPTSRSVTNDYVPTLSLQERLDISIFPAALGLWRDLRNNLGREVTLHLRLNNCEMMIAEGLFPAWSVTYAPPPGLINDQQQANMVAESRRRIAILQLECTQSLTREELEKARKKTQNLKASLAALYGTQEAQDYSLHSALDGATFMANRQRQSLFADLTRRANAIRVAPEEALWSGIPEEFERPARAVRPPAPAPAPPQQQQRGNNNSTRGRSRSRPRRAPDDTPYNRPPAPQQRADSGLVQEVKNEVARIQRMLQNLEGNRGNQGNGNQGNRGRRNNNFKRGGSRRGRRY